MTNVINLFFTARVDELETQITHLEEELDQQEKEATEAISSWEKRCAELEQKLVAGDDLTLRLLKEECISKQKILSEYCGEGPADLSTLYEQATVVDLLQVLSEGNERLVVSLKRLQEDNASLVDNGNTLTEEVAGYEQKIETMTADLEAAKAKASSKEELVKELESEVERLREKGEEDVIGDEALKAEREARKASEERVAELERKFKETEEHFNSRLEAAISDQARAQESLDSQRLLERERMEKLESERTAAESQKAALEQERDTLKVRVAELVDELQEASDAMQLCVTNEVSDKASELATEALRDQIEDMRGQAEANHRDFCVERQARHIAEQEVMRLRADLAAILGMENTEENHADMQRLTLEAKSNLQRKELAEMEALKDSLRQALDELSAARVAENEATERAAKANNQSSLYEQELVTAKGELKFLTQTMDEIKEADSTRRASLEYRVSSLENDNNVLRRFHNAEMENLRNELNQISMERDRLFQTLRDSEKSKEALVRASSRGSQAGEDAAVDLINQVELLRMEKTQLLSSAAEEASRVERRLREAVAAEKSSSEADLILQKELRLAAERALENIKLELSELRAEHESTSTPAASSADGTARIESENTDLKRQIDTLSDEKNSLEEELAEFKREAEKKADRLLEECRLAKAKAIQLERDGRYEAEILAEVSRLQARTNGHPLPDESDPAAEENVEDSTKLAKLCDVIQKQKDAIEEERSVYFELLAEHDDLLAVLAQHDLLKESLNAALERFGGQQAVDAAVHEAQEKAVAKYGKYVKL